MHYGHQSVITSANGPDIVECYMLRPFAHQRCMLLRVVAQSLKPVKLLAPCKRTQYCWELLRPFARSLHKRPVKLFFERFFAKVSSTNHSFKRSGLNCTKSMDARFLSNKLERSVFVSVFSSPFSSPCEVTIDNIQYYI